MANNEFLTMAELIKEYYDAPVGNYLNQSIVINNVTLPCDIYRVESDTVLTSAVFTGCTDVDANTQIVIGKNMSVASGTTLIPPYRCKGIIIGDVGTFTNSGTISMTARGASGEGKNIKLTDDYMISAVGGAGASSVGHYIQYNNTGFDGDNGSSPASGILSCGGGGSGSVSGTGGITCYTGAGGTGTSFSGGAGGGASTTGTGGVGSSTGGAGGNGVGTGSRGGAGNPKGNDAPVVSPDTNGTGTGGLIVILASSLISSGSFISEGSTAPGFTNSDVGRSDNAGGGASGGGCIVLISRIRDITGSASVVGGSRSSVTGTWIERGGAGGAGVYASYIVNNLILQNLPVEIAITEESYLDDIEPSDDVRIMGLTDKDELYYDIMGVRHKAFTVDASGELDMSRFVPPGVVHNATDGSPVGTVISFFGYIAPDGYLICDGSEYARADYPYLSSHLAALDSHYSTTLYNGSDAAHFKVPDLRGEFLRGAGTNGHSTQGDGENVGIHQDGTIHEFISVGQSSLFTEDRDSNRGYVDKRISNVNTYNQYDPAKTHLSGGGTWSGSNGTSRPTNTSVLYCIKYN